MNLAHLLAALIAVESGGNNHAIGDSGRSHGALQIQRGVILDVNRVHRTHFKLSDAKDKERAKRIAGLYLGIYCTKQRLGRDPTDEDAARIWNGGPNGHRKSATKAYWLRVRRHLK